MKMGGKMTDEEAKTLANDGRGKFRLWWVPQIPMKPFHYDVTGYQAGVMMADALAKYDAFQFEHNVKPDYANMGGVEFFHPDVTEGEWLELDEDEAEAFGWVQSQ